MWFWPFPPTPWAQPGIPWRIGSKSPDSALGHLMRIGTVVFGWLRSSQPPLTPRSGECLRGQKSVDLRHDVELFSGLLALSFSLFHARGRFGVLLIVASSTLTGKRRGGLY